MKRFLMYCLAVTVATAVASGLEYTRMTDGRLHVYFLNIGQGDAILIRTPHGKTVLVDGGPEDGVLFELGSVLGFWERTIDVMISTHPDKDHIEGLIPVLERYRVLRVMWTGVRDESSFYTAFLESVEIEGANIVITDAERDFEIDNVRFDVLYPFESLVGTMPDDQNSGSIVIKVTYGDFSVLLTGDAPADVERALIEREIDLRADVLKVGHHGSKTSTSADFLEAVGPQTAVIQAGRDNAYGHPHLDVLKKLYRAGAIVRRNDLEGRIELIR